ncbi:Spo0E family sporulation regulatory protein-aspartic acid phosphatase [Niallia sp. NCCP-28]
MLIHHTFYQTTSLKAGFNDFNIVQFSQQLDYFILKYQQL